MESFETSLVREKITLCPLDEPGGEVTNEDDSTVICSNRVLLKLGSEKHPENIVVRTQNMHTTLRFAGRIMGIYGTDGSLQDHDPPVDWQQVWESVLPDYEREFNESIWAAVFINGKSVFKTTSSSFMDVIERCAILTLDNYENTMSVTEDVLKQVGREMQIHHLSNIATVLTDSKGVMHCSFVRRSDGKGTTFSFTAEKGTTDQRITQSLSVAAGFLEGLSIRFDIQRLRQKVRRGKDDMKDARQLRLATQRLMELDRGITSFEGVYRVKYRPEKPSFFK